VPRHPEREQREGEEPGSQRPGDALHRDVEAKGDHVVRGGQLQVRRHGDDGNAERGPGRHVPRPVEDMVRPPVAGGPPLGEGVAGHEDEEDQRQ
jgi:hypothetical protein